MSSEVCRVPGLDAECQASPRAPSDAIVYDDGICVGEDRGDPAARWAIDAYETVASRIFPGVKITAPTRFIEQLATTSRAIVLVPR